MGADIQGAKHGAKQTGEQAKSSDWLDATIRIGLIGYGVVHLLIAWLAVSLALGDREGKVTSSGALQQLAESGWGKALLWIIAGGMLFLVIWQVLEGCVGHRDEDSDAKKWFKRAVSFGRAIVYGVLGFSAVKSALGQSGGGKGTDSMTAKLMSAPAGQFLVGLVALGILGFAIKLIIDGIRRKHAEDLEAEGKTGKSGRAYIVLGSVGYIAKGLAFGVIGVLFGLAAINHNAKKSGGMDQAFSTLLEQPFGPALVAAVGVGIGCYGLFCFAQARHLSDDAD